MGKISQLSSKYIINATIKIDGVVDKPDVVGAVFGQTEGLLGTELELRELQKSGRIGRIEVNVETRGGKTTGTIVIPSSLDKAETAVVGSSLEIIERIGPCNAKIKVDKIEDVRIAKRKQVIERAKELLKDLINNSMPDSQELSDEVASSVRVMEITSYGREKLPAGPSVADSDEIIVVEGRADVVNLLKHGFKNAVAINGTSVPKSIAELCEQKTVTVFVDGDRGGDLIIQELMAVADIDFVAKAPDGKEVEELTQKEIHKALRSKITAEQARHDFKGKGALNNKPRPSSYPRRGREETGGSPGRKVQISEEEKATFGKMLEDLIGTKGAYVLDSELNILGKVPLSELAGTVKSLSSQIFAIVMDGQIEKELVGVVERSNVKFLVAMTSKVKNIKGVKVLTLDNLQ